MDMFQNSATVLAMMAAIAACGSEKKQAAPANTPPTPKPGENQASPPAAPKPAEPAKPPQEAITRGMAKFAGDALVTCSQATVRYDAALKPTDVATFGPLMVAEDALVAALGGDAMLRKGGGAEQMSGVVAGLMFELTEEVKAKIGPEQEKELMAMREQLKATANAAKKEADGFVLVDSCEFPNRTALGTCALGDRGRAFEWSVALQHFDVNSTTDTDKAMKTCLTIGGKWSAAEGGAAAREHMKQHAQDLDKRMNKHMERLDELTRSVQ